MGEGFETDRLNLRVWCMAALHLQFDLNDLGTGGSTHLHSLASSSALPNETRWDARPHIRLALPRGFANGGGFRALLPRAVLADSLALGYYLSPLSGLSVCGFADSKLLRGFKRDSTE
jgi:hypothetical protein